MRTKIGLSFLIIAMVSAIVPAGASPKSNTHQSLSLDQLKEKLNKQYATIEKTIANPPNPADSPALVRTPGQPPYDLANYKKRLRLWQDDLAQSFKAAADTVDEILKTNPPDAEYWRERLETLQLYAEPVSSPDTRSIFGRSEVETSARILEAPPAVYTTEAQAAKARGDVRLRLVLAADGTVKYVFPIKSLRYGLTESAMAAAAQIKFEPAVRHGQPASQFVTLVYEFKDGQARKPYIPRTEF
jgi:TonB family protein